MPKAYVLFSGGLDSTVCLAIANKEHNGLVCAVSVNYGQRHQKELEAARSIIEHYNAASQVINLTSVMGKGGLTDPDMIVPEVDYSELIGVSPTYVPFRNGLMLSAITSIAAADPECTHIYFGAHADDAAGDAYPDCTLEFVGSMASAIFRGTYGKVRLVAPLLFNNKARNVEVGYKLEAPLQLSWSCYKGEEQHCGICSTCRDRKKAFAAAGVKDLTYYADEDYSGVPF